MRRSRLAAKKKPSWFSRLKGSPTLVPVEEIGLGVGGAALGAIYPPAGVLLIPAGAGLTVHGAKDLNDYLRERGETRKSIKAGEKIDKEMGLVPLFYHKDSNK